MAIDRNESFAHLANQVCKEFTFHRQDVAFWQALPEQYPQLSNSAVVSVVEQVQGGLVMALRTWLLDGHKQDVRKETTDIEFPKTPWQFFKMVYMPDWFTRHWPVKMAVQKVTVAEHHHHLCPHLVVEPGHLHYKWMAVQSGQWKDGDE